MQRNVFTSVLSNNTPETFTNIPVTEKLVTHDELKRLESAINNDLQLYHREVINDGSNYINNIEIHRLLRKIHALNTTDAKDLKLMATSVMALNFPQLDILKSLKEMTERANSQLIPLPPGQAPNLVAQAELDRAKNTLIDKQMYFFNLYVFYKQELQTFYKKIDLLKKKYDEFMAKLSQNPFSSTDIKYFSPATTRPALCSAEILRTLLTHVYNCEANEYLENILPALLSPKLKRSIKDLLIKMQFHDGQKDTQLNHSMVLHDRLIGKNLEKNGRITVADVVRTINFINTQISANSNSNYQIFNDTRSDQYKLLDMLKHRLVILLPAGYTHYFNGKCKERNVQVSVEPSSNTYGVYSFTITYVTGKDKVETSITKNVYLSQNHEDQVKKLQTFSTNRNSDILEKNKKLFQILSQYLTYNDYLEYYVKIRMIGMLLRSNATNKLLQNTKSETKEINGESRTTTSMIPASVVEHTPQNKRKLENDASVPDTKKFKQELPSVTQFGIFPPSSGLELLCDAIVTLEKLHAPVVKN